MTERSLVDAAEFFEIRFGHNRRLAGDLCFARFASASAWADIRRAGIAYYCKSRAKTRRLLPTIQ